MWICLNKAFVSIVEPRQNSPVLRVRARVAGHLEAAFPGCKPQRTPGRDYLFRVELPREQVAATVAQHVMGIGYGNFKNSVKNDPLHDAYARVWSVMSTLQPIRPYATKPDPKPAAKRRRAAAMTSVGRLFDRL